MVSLGLRWGDRLSKGEIGIDRAEHYSDTPWEADLSPRYDPLGMVHLQVVSLDLVVDARLATVASDNDLLDRYPDKVLGLSPFWVVDSLALVYSELLHHILPNA